MIMFKRISMALLLVGLVCSVWAIHSALAIQTDSAIQTAAVTPEEAAQLKTTLTPMGAERAGNNEGTIPPWTGGYTTIPPGFKNGGRRPDPFADEKPLFSITAKNMAQYADKLTDGTKAMLKRYPDSYRLDVYPTHRTFAAPQWVYDNTFLNATRAKLVTGKEGIMPEGAYGGTPFPIPHNGAEIMWNYNLRWKSAYHQFYQSYIGTADGKRVLLSDATLDQDQPYYFKVKPKNYDGTYLRLKIVDTGPPIRTGEGLLVYTVIDDSKSQGWVYLVGQRRVRMTPDPRYDTPAPATAGLSGVDDVGSFSGPTGKFNYKILGKKEMYIPYNMNKLLVPNKSLDVVGPHFMNPDYIRWELHRVWVVEATLAPGQRQEVHRSLYYIDEDSWFLALADRWDAKGVLWKSSWTVLLLMPDLPGFNNETWGFYDFIAGTWFVTGIMNEQSEQIKYMPPYPADFFTTEALANASMR
jgi:hypothetical protein